MQPTKRIRDTTRRVSFVAISENGPRDYIYIYILCPYFFVFFCVFLFSLIFFAFNRNIARSSKFCISVRLPVGRDDHIRVICRLNM
jgi:hypothetical protein